MTEQPQERSGLVTHLVALVTIFFFAYVVGNVLSGEYYAILNSFPIGSDTLSHVSKILYLKEYFAFGWYFKEGMGYPYLTLYPPMSYYLAFLLSFLPLEIFRITNIMAFAAIVLSAYGIYWFLTVRFNDILMALTGSLLYLIARTAATWNGVAVGLWPSVIATPFSILAFPTFLLWIRSGKRIWLAATTLLVAAAVVTHIAVGAVGAIALFLYALAERISGESGWRAIKGSIAVGVGALGLSAFWSIPFLSAYPLSGFVFTIRQPVDAIQFIEFFFRTLPNVTGITIVTLDSHAYPPGYFSSPIVPNSSLVLLLVPLFYYSILARLIVYSFLVAGLVHAIRSFRKGVWQLPLALMVVFLPLSAISLNYLFFQNLNSPAAVERFNFANIVMLGILAGFGVANIRDYLFKTFKVLASVQKKKLLSLALSGLVVLSSMFFAWSTLMPSVAISNYAGQYGLAQDIAKTIGNNRAYYYDVSPNLGGLKQLLPVVSEGAQVDLYFGQGSVTGGWSGYEQGVLYGTLGGPEEVKTVLKWFGIRYIILRPLDDSGQPLDPLWKYDGPEFKQVLRLNQVLVLEYTDWTQSISASNIPAVLVIGSKDRDAYTTVLRSTISSRIDPDTAILVKGSEYVDDYSYAELGGFAGVILQGYAYHDHDRAWQLLDEYVSKGGNVFIDTGWQFISQDWQSASIPTPSPVTETSWSTFEKQWNFAYQNTSFTQGVDFSRFPSPVFGNSPAGFSVPSSGDVRDWAKPVLSSWGKPLIVAGQYGKGKVIWSGMNLIANALDATTANNYEESKLLSNLLSWLVSNSTSQSINSKTLSWGPEKLELQISGFSGLAGVLVREAYFPNWHAYLESGNQMQQLQIYQAGPQLMYIRVPVQEGASTQMRLVYESSTLDLASLSVSIVSLVVLGIWISGRSPNFQEILGRPFRRIGESWGEEE